MCGIVYMQSYDGSPVNKLVYEQFDKQRSRGVEGFGIFNGTHLVKAAQEKRITRWLKRPKNESNMILFHHRMPTSTINVRRAAHPFTTKDYFGNVEYVLVHNGWVSNADKLWQNHQDEEKVPKEVNYSSLLEDLTFNDSESLLWDFALTMEGKQERQKAYGHVAFVCMRLVNGVPEKLFFYRNPQKPLHMERSDKGLILSSEGPGKDIEADTLYTYNYALNRLTSRHWKIWTYNPEYTYNSSVEKRNTSSYPYSSSVGHDERFDGLRYEMQEDGTIKDLWSYDADENEELELARVNKVLYERRHKVPTIKKSNGATKIGDMMEIADMYLKQLPQDIKDGEAFGLLVSYLKESKGDYDQAYAALEADYDLFDAQAKTKDVTKYLNCILEAVEILYRDPLYAANKKVNHLFVPENKQLLLGTS